MNRSVSENARGTCSEKLKVPQGEFELALYPTHANQTFRAWDAADELLLRHLAGRSEMPDANGGILIVNDNAGALSTALAGRCPMMLSDSFLAHTATRNNLLRNAIDVSAVRSLSSFDPLPASIDVVVMKIPKSLALLEDQLHRIAPHLHERTLFIAGAMTRHIHTSTLKLFSNIVGPARTTLAERKARLVFCSPDPGLERPPNPWPKTYRAGSMVAISHAGVFSDSRLDRGTAFLLDHMTQPFGPMQIIDLGCGNGVLGVKVALDNPDADVTFIDASCRAVASAEATFRANLGLERRARFLIGNGIFDIANDAPPLRGAIDRVINNPPFHENHAICDATAMQMFSESYEVLRRGGELWVVGNRHLGYQVRLKHLFGNCESVSSNDRFTVLRSFRT